MKPVQFKPVKFPTRRSRVSEVRDYIWNNEPAFAAVLIVALFAVIGVGYSLASLLDHVTAAWGL